VSQSNTIDQSSSGITGLSVTALTTGATTVTVGSDTSAVATQIQNLVTQYNNVESYIDTNAASSTDSNGAVTSGTLTGDMTAADLSSSLRNTLFSPVSVSGLSTAMSQLASLGITSNGYNNSVSLDSTTLSSVLTNNLSNVQKLFSDPANGLAVKLDSYLNDTIGDNGTITQHQAALTAQSKSINTQISNLEKQITSDSNYWTTEFQNMETAESQMNQELSSLQQQINKGTL
jgi:flagellar hook-associated protein 2